MAKLVNALVDRSNMAVQLDSSVELLFGVDPLRDAGGFAPMDQDLSVPFHMLAQRFALASRYVDHRSQQVGVEYAEIQRDGKRRAVGIG